MSLSSQIKDSKSSVRRFFSEHLPNTSSVVRECNANQFTGTETIKPAASGGWHPSTVGTAFHYRTIYYSTPPPMKELTAWTNALVYYAWDTTGDPLVIPAEVWNFFGDLKNFLEQTRPAGKRLECWQEMLLVRYCSALALFETYKRSADSLLKKIQRQHTPTTDELLSIVEDPVVEDLCTLSMAFGDHFGEALKRAKFGPTFSGGKDVGGARGDFVLDGCLIDIKLRTKPILSNVMLYQLLGYALLDHSDEHEIREVGIYFARQKKLVRWLLDDLISTLGGGRTLPLDELRKRFGAALREEANTVVQLPDVSSHEQSSGTPITVATRNFDGTTSYECANLRDLAQAEPGSQ